MALALLAASCSGVTDPATSVATSAEVPTTEAITTAPTSTIDESSTTATTVASTTTSTVLPTTTVSAGDPAIRLEEIVFAGEPYLIIGNRGSGAGSTAGLWICQFPAYYELPAFELQPGERLAVPLGEGAAPDLVGVVATVEVVQPLGAVTSHDGEIGLYSSNEFNSPQAILDYVEWGFPGHAREEVAVAAQIWTTNGYVEVPAELLAIVVQAFPTVGPQDWFAEIGG